MWKRVGAAAVGPLSGMVTLGRVAATYSGGMLPLRFRSQAGRDMAPLSFGVVLPVSADEEGGLPPGRYYPGPDPQIVNLGPGIGAGFDGVIRFKPRAYNLRWLQVGIPAASWQVTAEVWAPEGFTRPDFTVYGFQAGPLTFNLSVDRVGPEQAAPLSRD